MNQSIKYTVNVLLATYNGSKWIGEQLQSILNQQGVNINVYVSDDHSNDGTFLILENCAIQDPRIKIFSQTHKFDSAGKNFYHLIQEVDISGFDYIAFADQDDIWEQDKLINHINLLKKYDAEAVSSNVIAFWPNGKKKLIKKSQPQRELDYLFESAGPGCTFLMNPWLVNKVREQLNDDNSVAKEVVLHDWLTYAVCRAHGRKWIIDGKPSIQYRQHENNVVGANSGLKAKWVRLMKLRQGWYRSEVTKVSQVCATISGETEIKSILYMLTNKNIISQLKLLFYVPQARRKTLDRLVLFVLILCFLF